MLKIATHAPLMRVVFTRCFATMLLFAALCMAFSSCKKEYIDWPYNDIEKFAIKDETGQELKALIQNETIIVSWPPFQAAPDSIAPEISVSDRATIVPASGTRVALKSGLKFEVTAQDGSKKTYTLAVVNSQPKPSYQVSDLATGVTLGGSISILGEYFIADSNQTTLHLLGKTNNEFKISLTRLNTSILSGTVPTTIDTGKYVVKFRTGNYTFAKDTIRILRPAFSFTVNQASSVSVRKGGELVLDVAPLIEKWYAEDAGYALLGQGIISQRIELVAQAGQNTGVFKFRMPAATSLTQIQSITIYDKNDRRLGTRNLAVAARINIVD